MPLATHMTLDGRHLTPTHRAGDAVAAAAGQHGTRRGLQVAVRWQSACLLGMAAAADAAAAAADALCLLVLIVLLAGTHDVRFHPGAQLGAEHCPSISLTLSVSLSKEM